MRTKSAWRASVRLGGWLAGAVVSISWLTGCAGSTRGGAFEFIGTPFTAGSGSAVSGPATTGRTGGAASAGIRADVDPCQEPQPRKYVRISMRNLSSDYIHYFLILVAFVRSDTYPEGAVCPSDIALYRQFGYTEIRSGQSRAYGNYCIRGPALVYFHRGGQFRGAGAQGLGSAIAPAQGRNATYDSFFGPAGQLVPVPNQIIFHNPGIGDGARLKVSFSAPEPCNESAAGNALADPPCAQDAFYYVDEFDSRVGSRVLGSGSYVRTPDEIQDTGCTCGLGTDRAFQELAPSTTTAGSAECNEFLRGGRIDYVFVRDDTEPPYPQLVWRVTDAGGARAHDFDPRARVP